MNSEQFKRTGGFYAPPSVVEEMLVNHGVPIFVAIAIKDMQKLVINRPNAETFGQAIVGILVAQNVACLKIFMRNVLKGTHPKWKGIQAGIHRRWIKDWLRTYN